MISVIIMKVTEKGGKIEKNIVLTKKSKIENKTKDNNEAKMEKMKKKYTRKLTTP
jgi:hypothetical protein